MLRSPLLSNTHATRGACAALVRPYGNGALSICSMVKLSPKQTTASNALPRLTARKYNDFFNTVAHYHRRTITRRMDLIEPGRRGFFGTVKFADCLPSGVEARSAELLSP